MGYQLVNLVVKKVIWKWSGIGIRILTSTTEAGGITQAHIYSDSFSKGLGIFFYGIQTRITS